MKKTWIIVALVLGLNACGTLPSTAHHHTKTTIMNNKTTTLLSQYSFDETLSRLKNAINDKNMTIFALIDHQEAAKKADLHMQKATVIIYGTPKAGTPLMIKDPSFALKLPLKVLITENKGQVLVIFEPAQSVIVGSDISYEDIKDTLAGADKLIESVVK